MKATLLGALIRARRRFSGGCAGAAGVDRPGHHRHPARRGCDRRGDAGARHRDHLRRRGGARTDRDRRRCRTPPTRCRRCSRRSSARASKSRDVQTSTVNLSSEYRYPENQAPQLVGYTASNSVTIRFRDIRNSGKTHALVGQGANQISGPNLVGRQARGGARRSARQGDRVRPRARRPLCPCARPPGGAGRGDQRERRLCVPAAADADVRAGGNGKRRDLDRAGRAEAPGQSGDDLRVAVKQKRPRSWAARPSNVAVVCALAHRAPANEVDDREQDDRADQRIKECSRW